ncbi:protein of unknown function [Halomicrobium zhouii]|uniref:DUF4397 domain-containing protein n=1 Tax=Halomicrobium zhouii TaxID=767519 RepID=A0A1I6KML9_9EURY|nr:DUF4397 domain-containing protein [Halomicrobium zhouii]SFR92268.1 protein of unknown function [Halomicrobium zhouii]
MSDNRRTKVVAVALAVTLLASVFAGGAIVAAQTDGNETGNETETEADDGLNETETEADDGLNETDTETEADDGLNETETETEDGLNETENETDAGLNETETETEAGVNETDDEDEEEPEAESDVGIIADDDENETENVTDARGDEPAAANETTDEMDTQQTTYLRVVHGAPDVDAVDVSIDNETVLEEVPYGAVSDYLTLQAGEYNVTVTTSEDDEVVYSENVTLDPRTVTTFAATSGEMTDEDEADEEEADEEETPELEAATFNDNAYEPADGEAAVSVVHLSPDAGNVDVTVEGSDVVLADNLSYQNASDYVTVPEGDYTVEVRMEGDEEGSNILETFDVTVEGGTAYSAIALGYDQPPADSQRSLNLTAAEDATTTVNLPGEDNETAMNETANETDAGLNETETETETNVTANETETGLNETETETETETDVGLNETETETETDTGLDETETETDDGNLTIGGENETEANETGNDTLLLAP